MIWLGIIIGAGSVPLAVLIWLAVEELGGDK